MQEAKVLARLGEERGQQIQAPGPGQREGQTPALLQRPQRK